MKHRALLSVIALGKDIKLSHTVFAMPFALLGMCLAAGSVGRLPCLGEIVLIIVCMVLARTVAMTVNRWVDAKIDAQNPRTAGRAIPSGRVTRSTVLGAAILCGVGFILAAGGFWVMYGNMYPLALSPAVLAVLGIYSFAKRVTWLCHLILGGALAISPIAAALAIEPEYLTQPTLYALSLMVLSWVGGFDVIYALQDVEADRQQGLFSIPARFGVEPALWISRALHLVAIAALITCWRTSPQLAFAFALAVALTAALLLLEHTLIWRSKTRNLHLAFFTVNGLISLLLGVTGIIEIVS